MLAAIEKFEDGVIAQYDRPLEHSPEKVWAAITENEKLSQWMPNLQIIDLKENGTIQFNMNDGSESSFDIKIKDYKENEVLKFDWGAGWVRFELAPQPKGCLLILRDFIRPINDHTAKDLAGWHVCLDVLRDLLNGKHHAEFPKENWEKWHREYKNSLKQLNS